MSVTIAEVILFIGMTGITLFFIFFVIPGWIQDLHRLTAFDSAQIVARDLSGLISISGASTDQITLRYNVESEKVLYNVELKDRIITVVRLYEEKNPSDPAKVSYAVDSLSKNIEGAKSFVVGKKDGKYSFEAIE